MTETWPWNDRVRSRVMRAPVWSPLLSLAIFAGCSLESATPPDAVPDTAAQQAAEVSAFELVPQDVLLTSTVVTSVEAWEEVEVAAQRQGRVDMLAFDDGDFVERGELLATVDVSRAHIGVRDASAALQLAQANLGIAQALTRPQELRIAEAGLGRAESQYQLAKREFERVRNLFKTQNASQSQFDVAKTELEVAQREFETTRERLGLAETGSREEEILISEAQLEQARVRLEIAYDDLDKALVESPLSGHVARRHVDRGEVVSEGTPVATIVDISRLKAIASIAQEDIVWIQTGAAATVRLDAFPDETFAGVVHVLDWVGDPRSRTFRAEIAIENPGHRIRPGMMGRVTFTLENRRNALAVNADLLWERSGRLGVFVVKEETVHFRPVTIGRYFGDRVLIDEGLQAGDQVVATAPEGLADGQAVRERKPVSGIQ